MSFCAIFIAILLERFFDYTPMRQWKWFAPYQRLIAQKLSGQSSYVIFGATLAPFLLLALLVVFFLDNALFGFIKLFFSIAIILYCFGPRNLWADIFACLIDITNSDAKALSERLKIAFNVVPTDGPQTMHKELISQIYIQANRRVFAIMFWFGILGIFGVILYRLLTMMVGEGEHKDNVDPAVTHLARLGEGYMEWLSVRVFTLLFALGGNFSRVFSAWRQDVLRGVEGNDAVLVDCGIAALNTTANKDLPTDGSLEKEQISLLDRSFTILLIILAILVYWIP